MPKPTFLRLSPAKQKAFIRAALTEFSKHTFAEASVSRLVQHLGIAKGSIYQYFEDKSDVYQYLVEISLDRKYEILDLINNHLPETLETWYFRVCLAEIKFAEEFPDMYLLLKRAAFDFPERLDGRDHFYLEQSVRRFDTGLSDIIDITDIVFLLSTFKSGIVAKYAGKLAQIGTVERINTLVTAITKVVTD